MTDAQSEYFSVVGSAGGAAASTGGGDIAGTASALRESGERGGSAEGEGNVGGGSSAMRGASGGGAQAPVGGERDFVEGGLKKTSYVNVRQVGWLAPYVTYGAEKMPSELVKELREIVSEEANNTVGGQNQITMRDFFGRIAL